MVYNREGYAPWSLTRKAGVQSATVDGDISVPQYIQPILDTGFVDFKGDWKGRTSSDEQFFAFGYDEAVANGATILAPQAPGSTWPLDMTGYSDLQIAIKPSNGGNCLIQAVMAPATFAYANLKDVNAATALRGCFEAQGASSSDMANLFSDNAESLTADVWNIFIIQNRLRNAKLLQFKITNNSGGESTIETAFMRIV